MADQNPIAPVVVPAKMLSSLLAAVPDPMLLVSAQGSIELANPPAIALFGRWISGRNYATVLRQPQLLGRIEQALTSGDGGESRFVQADQTGETIFRAIIHPLAREEAGYDGILLHFQDITHLREAEEMRRDFVANVSHELRTPLTAIMGFIETLKGPARGDPDAQTRFLGIMEEEARRMNRMISDLLSLSRVEGQERQRPSDAVDLAAVLSRVIEALRPMAKEQGSHLTLDLPPADEDTPDAGLMIRGDPDQLMQLFLNLTENALKYGGRGKPVQIAVAKGQGSGSMKGAVVQIDVIDKGEGIDPLHLPRLTERFYRVDDHRSRAMGGTGLGLAIVKHIVNRHRGRLRIASEQGQGSTFSVILPRD